MCVCVMQRQCNHGNRREDEDKGVCWLMRLSFTQLIKHLYWVGEGQRSKGVGQHLSFVLVDTLREKKRGELKV